MPHPAPASPPPSTHAYVAFRPCTHPVALCVDEQNTKEERWSVARFVREQIAAGYTVQRMTIEEARLVGVVYCKCARRPETP